MDGSYFFAKKIPKKTFLQAKVITCRLDRPPEREKVMAKGTHTGAQKYRFRGAHIIGFGH
jgi:hypothetical protein